MKILLDEDVPQKLVRALFAHEVQTVVSMQWGGIKNGALLRLIESGAFHVFVTGDKNMPNQQSLQGRPFAILILSAINWPVIRPHLQKIIAAVEEAQPGTVNTVDCGMFVRRAK